MGSTLVRQMQSRNTFPVPQASREKVESLMPSAGNDLPALEVFAAAATSGEENDMRKLLLLSAAAALISTGAFAQSTVTTTGTGHTTAVQIEPEYRTKIRSHVTEHKIRPVETREKIVVGSPVPSGVELEAVPAEWGSSLTKYRYVYSGERVMLVDPPTRTVVQEVD
ncbi:DUF1236 domain-containing protein [Bradyrhizobium sp. CCGUVB23]|uniref:DUF1236 domain-containing protein n=1 Tax=Bradyrhizobium sp. CCGUVB23 TaxID=2949630 RepID=UPI0020B40D3D|nr:DUF1236 domain-containing protein [Bradyrhizobium sp. CCGUVB23]MCP3459754.1 DUF1236 domain-containing protein [Bradyrhizobium sp. CCGUVB23]